MGKKEKSIEDKLKEQIDAGKIIFDTGSETKLKKELLQENTGTKVTEDLQKLVHRLSTIANIRVSSLIRNSGHHGSGKAVDIGNEEVAKSLLPGIATDTEVANNKIDEIIFDAKVADSTYDRNKWNYDQGSKHDYNSATLDDHKNHIHFAVK
jgi:hypothetical protein